MILITVTLTGCFIAFTHHPLTRQRVSDSGLYMDVEWIRNVISWLWQVTGFIEIVPEKVNMDQSLSVMFPCWICNIKTCCLYCQSTLLPAAVTNKLQKAGLNRFYDAMHPRVENECQTHLHAGTIRNSILREQMMLMMRPDQFGWQTGVANDMKPQCKLSPLWRQITDKLLLFAFGYYHHHHR